MLRDADRDTLISFCTLSKQQTQTDVDFSDIGGLAKADRLLRSRVLRLLEARRTAIPFLHDSVSYVASLKTTTRTGRATGDDLLRSLRRISSDSLKHKTAQMRAGGQDATPIDVVAACVMDDVRKSTSAEVNRPIFRISMPSDPSLNSVNLSSEEKLLLSDWVRVQKRLADRKKSKKEQNGPVKKRLADVKTLATGIMSRSPLVEFRHNGTAYVFQTKTEIRSAVLNAEQIGEYISETVKRMLADRPESNPDMIVQAIRKSSDLSAVPDKFAEASLSNTKTATSFTYVSYPVR